MCRSSASSVLQTGDREGVGVGVCGGGGSRDRSQPAVIRQQARTPLTRGTPERRRETL